MVFAEAQAIETVIEGSSGPRNCLVSGRQRPVHASARVAGAKAKQRWKDEPKHVTGRNFALRLPYVSKMN